MKLKPLEYWIYKPALKEVILTEDDIKKIVRDTIVTSIQNFAKSSLKKKPKFQILDLLIPKERKIRSIVGGLEGSLGTTLWEPLGKALAAKNGFNVINQDLLCPSNMPAALSNTVESIKEDRNAEGGLYDAKSSHEAIKRVCQNYKTNPIDSFKKPKSGRGVDIWLEKDGINYFFDTKTVQPNLSTLTGCLDQVIGWYSFYYSKYPEGTAIGRIVFPYNPTPEKSFWKGVIGGGKPLEPSEEAWVEDEFWDFCSGYKGTYSIIKEAFHEIRESGELKEVLDELLSDN